jgi:hypothetical protein
LCSGILEAGGVVFPLAQLVAANRCMPAPPRPPPPPEPRRSILLTPERNCSICYKRIGTAALVAFPWGLLAHYSCHRRASGAGGTTGGTQYAANGRPAAGVTAGTAGPGGVRGWA